jgi:hypothetical protein
MTFGTSSKIFRNWVKDLHDRTTSAIDLDTDVPKVALYGNTGTPNQDDTAAHNAYNGAGGAWVTANEVTDTNWAAGGRALSGITTHFADTAGIVWYDAADTAGAGNVTVANVYGVLVYDDTVTTPVADLGMSYHAFSTQPAGVTAGTFTVVWDSNGIHRYTL